MNCNNNQNNNNGCGCNCNPHPTPAPKPVDIHMNVCDRNINMLPMLQTYTTKVLKPNINGCCKKNILTQEMMNCEDMKYVIKWDFDLNGKTITVPNNCILEFDGGSLKNGTIIGQDTVYINVGDVDIWGENLTREGTWREHSGGGGSIDVDDYLSDTSTNPVQNKVITEALEEIALPDKPYNPEAHSGLGRKTLELKEDGSNILTQEDFNQENTIYVVQYDFDLNGAEIDVPSGSIIEFDGGSISNGTISGNHTQISTDSENIFTNVVIGGTWNVPYISSTWFSDATDNNTIKQIFNLTNSDVKNVVIIHEGLYNVSISADRETVIALNSNTDVKIAGTIQLLPNAFGNYDIIQILNAHNVTVDGGTIIGDKVDHTGTTGEWGMGIDIDHSKNVVVSNIVIKDCWGDSVYIGSSENGVSENIKIENFNLSGSRRQGISVINVKNLTIVNGFISDINGTLPMCCIDLEPNRDTDIIENVVIKNVTCDNSRLGIVSYYRGTSPGIIKDIVVENCIINSTSFRCTQNVRIANCSYDSNIGTLPKISFYYSTDVVVENCKVNDIISDLSTAVEHCIFILRTQDSLFDRIELETNRQYIIRNERYNRIINSTLVNTSDNGTFYREDTLFSNCFLQNNRINVHNIHLPSWTNMIGNECTCKLLTCDWGNTLSENIINAERIKLGKYCSIINSNITAEYCQFGNCIISSNHIASKQEITTGINEFIYCEYTQIFNNIIEYNASSYTDSIVLKVGNESKIINNKVVLTKAPEQNVFRGLYDVIGIVLENNTVDRSALEDAQELSYINTDLLHNNKVVVPLKTIGTLEERNSLDTFYLIDGFMYFVTDSNPAKWSYRKDGAWVDL